MAEDQDQSQKTEEPSQRRLQKAEDEGKAPHSKELNHFIMLLSLGLLLVFYFPFLAKKLQITLSIFIESAHELYLHSFSSLIIESGFLIAIPLLGLFIVAMALGIIENKFRFSLESILPKIEKISPFRGLKRIFSMKNFFEFLKSFVYISIFTAIIFYIVYYTVLKSKDFIWYSFLDLIHYVHDNLTLLFIMTICVVAVTTILDILYQRYEFRKSLRMTKQEVKDEHKETEGDPYIKARIRRIRMERSRKRMMANVPKASVIITNPTHYAIALQYEYPTMNAPIVIAKGQDFIAAKIREIAEENRIPIVENKPLARALYQVDLEAEIPLEHYKAVADIIVYVMNLQKKLPHQNN